MKRLFATASLIATAWPALAQGSPGEAAMTMSLMEQARSRIAMLIADLGAAGPELSRLAQDLQAAAATGAGVRAATYLLILLIIGIGAEWLYWTYAWSPLHVIHAIPVTSRRHAFALALRRFWLRGSGLLLFAITLLGAATAFSWPDGVLEMLIAGTFTIILVRLVALLMDLTLAPGHPGLMLVDVDPARVRMIFALMVTLALLFAIGRFVPDTLMAASPHAAHALQFACGTLAAALVLGAALFAYRHRPASAGLAQVRRLPTVPKSLRVIAVVLLVYAFWLLIGASSAQVVAILGIVVALERNLHDAVFFFWREDMAAAQVPAALAGDGQAQTAQTLDQSVVPNVILAAMRLLTVLLGLAACALALGVPVMTLAMSEHPVVRFAIRILGVAALALLTNVVWIIIKSAIDHRLRMIGPPDQHAEPGPNARLRTLLPLCRISSAVFLVSMFVLSALWALGIEITPLLAGAGVIGLALGFGAQALVRDIIAGIFLLVEDVFRVGEYIESGSSTKGTVERITLRTVALRHHNGPLHFVPFGSLGVVRNNSRDWVIEKFNLPLPITADSERVRKMIKKIGQEMLSDPEVAPLIREPLKGKLYKVEPGLKIFRCSFQTAPGNQFDVRAAAYRRIELGMKDLGISFHDGRQVLVQEQVGD